MKNFKQYFFNQILLESPEGKIRKYGISDPFYVNLIHRYESLLDWNKIKTSKDLVHAVAFKLKEISNPEQFQISEKDINWDKERKALQGAARAGNVEAEYSLNTFDSDPEYYKGMLTDSINEGKREVVEQWLTYLNSNPAYNKAYKFIVMDSILKKEKKRRNPPPSLNSNTLARVYDKIYGNPTQTFRIKPFYNEYLKLDISNTSETVVSDDGMWVKIPGVKTDPDNIDDNISKLMGVAADNWCVKQKRMAEHYLKGEGNDFWVYLIDGKEGKTAVASVRVTERGNIEEISGTEGGALQRLHDKYIPVVSNFVENQNLTGKDRYLIELLANQKNYDKIRELAENGTIDLDGDYISYHATNSNDIELMKIALENGLDPNKRDGQPLRHASRKGHIQIVKMLLNAGANPNLPAITSKDALSSAVIGNHLDIVKILLDAGANPDVKDGQPLVDAAYNGYIPIINLLIKFGAKVTNEVLSFASKEGHAEAARILLKHLDEPELNDSSLINAAEEGHTEIVKMLLDAGSNPNGDNNNGMPLAYAINNEEEDIVNLLLNAGADPSLHSDIIKFAITNNNNNNLVKMLLDSGADPNRHDNRPIIMASEQGYSEIVKLLLDAGATPDNEALKNAGENGFTDTVKLLLDAGANPNISYEEVGNETFSLLYIAAWNGYWEVLEYLLNAGGDPDFHHTNSPLKGASINNYPTCTELLLKAGANPNIENSKPLEYAAYNGFTDIVNLLLNAGATPTKKALDDATSKGNPEIVDILTRALNKQ